MNQAERNEKMEEYGRGFELFATALAGIPRQAWDFKPPPAEWSIHETIVHMSDSESIGASRVRELIAEPGGILMVYDDAKWAQALNYQDQSVDDARQIFKLTRQMTYRLLKTLPDRVFAHTVVHPEAVYPEFGEAYTLDKWLNIYVNHVPNHIGQLKKTYQAWKEQNR